ncbi:MAG: hypothetical protein V1802_01665 [Candidatus Aenigmatarchaeota archaeon]
MTEFFRKPLTMLGCGIVGMTASVGAAYLIIHNPDPNPYYAFPIVFGAIPSFNYSLTGAIDLYNNIRNKVHHNTSMKFVDHWDV